MSLPKLKGQISVSRLALLILLILIIFIGAIPGYLSGKWTWAEPPAVSITEQLKSLKKTGLTPPGWKTLDQKEGYIGGHLWSVQIIQPPNQKPITMFLLPQTFYRNQPEVEWMDVNGLQRWEIDSLETLEFSVKDGTNTVANVKARFFRALKNQTFAVIQWYAWPGGGNFSPANWFWADQFAQLRGRRLPWVAVCLIIPIDPFSDVKDAQSLAKSLAQTVQSTLNTTLFSQSL